MTIAIREATPADVPALARLRAETWGTEEYWQERVTAYLRREQDPQHALQDRVVYVAVEENVVVGLIAGHLTRRFECDGELEWVDVTAKRRGAGIAVALLRTLALWFQSQGAKRVCVDVDPEKGPAQAFYRKHGAEDLKPYWLVWGDIAALATAAKGQ